MAGYSWVGSSSATTGNDTLYANEPGSTLQAFDGLAGTDVFKINTSYKINISNFNITKDANGVVTVSGASNGHRVNAQLSNFEEIVYKNKSGVLTTIYTANIGSSSNTNTPSTGDDTLTGTTGNDSIHALAGNDSVDGLAGNDKLYGEDGNDTLTGGEGNDTLVGGNGDDTLNGNAGNDKITDDAGNNTVAAGEGNNTVVTAAGNDIISAGTGNDKITAGDGTNTITAGDGNNTITAGSGSDTITTGAGNDKIVAGDGVNLIHSGAGNDTITTGSGSDTIYGEAGADKIVSGAGNDVINGGAGADKLTGGDGADTFIFANLGTTSVPETDTISDFTEDDIIQIDTSVFTKLAGATTDMLVVASTTKTAVAADSNDYLIYNAAKGALYYDADGSNSGAAIKIATIKGSDAKTLDFTDFSFI